MRPRRRRGGFPQGVIGVAPLALLIAIGNACAGSMTDGDTALLPPAPMHEQVLSLPGDPGRPVTLQVTEFTPDGRGPFPLAVLNHGANGNDHPENEPRYRTTFLAYYFLSRGYAVVLPMMRGFAGSGGQFVHNRCDVADTGIANAHDIAAVIDAVAAQPNIDVSRIVVAGQSFGGWNTLAFGTLDHAGVRGLVNFAGGVREADCPTQDASLVAASAYLGAHTRVPSIWFYGDNDKTFPSATWRGMYARYTSAGGRADLVAYGTFQDDAHQMLSHAEGLAIWAPQVDAFLDRVGLPGKLIDPTYLPTPLPAPTHYASIDDDAAVPYLPATNRAAYRDFLRRPFTRAFVIAPNGIVAATSGGFDPIARALSLCGQHAAGCQLYAVNGAVVWTKPKLMQAEPPKQPIYHRTVAAGATAALDFSYGVNPDCSSRGVPRIWLTQQPLHGTAKVEQRSDFPRFPANHPDVVCNATRVPGMSVEYTPDHGFRGEDSLVFEEINLDNRDLVFRIAILVQ
jgi:dienelactone hydrolase